MLFRSVEKMLIRGVTRDNDVARISIMGVPDQPGIAFKIFSHLASKKVNVDLILQSIGRDNTKDISFTVSRSHKQISLEVMEKLNEQLSGSGIVCDDNVSKVSIVGAGMQTNPGVASKMFEALAEAGINIQMISTSEIKISVLVALEDSDRAVKSIHEAFDL